MDRRDAEQAFEDAAEREDDEATSLNMLADADERAPATAALATSDRAVALELELEAEYLRERAAEARGTTTPPREVRAGGRDRSGDQPSRAEHGGNRRRLGRQ